jgi:hypothetical protein
MNIFVLDYDPVKAAQMHCDKHVMNYTQTKDLCVSRFIDFSNENASPCFCFKSVVQSLNQTIFLN